MDTYGTRLRKTREATGESVRSMARALSCSPTHLSDLELDRRCPSDALERDICNHLDVDPSSLGDRASDLMRRLRPRMVEPAFLVKLAKLLGDSGKAAK